MPGGRLHRHRHAFFLNSTAFLLYHHLRYLHLQSQSARRARLTHSFPRHFLLPRPVLYYHQEKYRLMKETDLYRISIDTLKATPPRSLTADFFSTSPSISAPPKTSPAPRRKFLNLQLNGDEVKHMTPVTLAGAFASTPTPTESRDQFNFIGDKTSFDSETRSYSSSWSEHMNEPTPKPPPKSPSLVYYPGRGPNGSSFDVQQLPSSVIPTLGAEPDAEVLSTSPSFSHLPSLGLTAAQGLSAYPSRPTSSHSLHSAASQVSQELNTSMTHSLGEPDLGEGIFYPAGEEELAAGMIIRSFLPSQSESKKLSGVMQPLSVSTASSNSSAYSNNMASVPVTLRLSRALGQGTFSSVWLAEDLSPTSLLLRSRKSLKDLKRKSTMDLKANLDSGGTGRGNQPTEPIVRENKRANGKLKSSLGTTSSLMRRLRGGVSGTRPGGASASSGQASTDDAIHVSIAMGRQGTLMPSPIPPTSTLPSPNTATNGLLLDLPPALIPGHPSHSMSPPLVSSSRLGLGLPFEQDRISSASSARSVYLEFSDEPIGLKSLSPPKSPDLYSDRLSIIGLDAPHHNYQNSSVSRASSVSWKSSVSSDEGQEGGAEDGSVCRTSSTRSNLSSRSYQKGRHGLTSRRSSTKSSVRRDRSRLRSRLVAVKLTSRGVIEERERVPGQVLSRQEKMEEEERARERDRTRVSFVREVEVMKHISHPNITPLLSHLTTRTHHVLVLPYLPGGDLLGLVNDETTWNNLGENTLRRIFSELCKAVGWLHGVGLVHRDIKLENILLTVSLSPQPLDTPGSGSTMNGVMLTEGNTTASPTNYSFSASSQSTPSSPTSDFHSSSVPPSSATRLPTPPQPLIKLTDFGLSRFIDPANPLLTTRCGSEAYAAPELVVSGGRAGVASSTKSPWFMEEEAAGYAHETDSESENAGGYDARETDAWACGVVLYALVARRLPFGEGPGETLGAGQITGEGGFIRGFSPMERRQWLMKIARGEWHWPGIEMNSKAMMSSELHGSDLVRSIGAKRAVAKLLVRDPSRRARIKDFWNDEWVQNFPVDGGDSIDGLPSDSDSYSPYIPDVPSIPSLHEFTNVSSQFSSGHPNPYSTSLSGLPPQFGRPSVSDNVFASTHEDDDDEFDNDRRENQEVEVNGDDDPGSATAEEDDELEEEEDGEGWLVDKDSINHIARSEVPR
ncbi:MAG: hypothetical protein NXY57DRAFT_515651 [Lentinula lateritia]|nr:MAG: hypothetical protein NXY57DRAFT_515651 [Lentinula lateritia]